MSQYTPSNDFAQAVRDVLPVLRALSSRDEYDATPLAHHPARKDLNDVSLVPELMQLAAGTKNKTVHHLATMYLRALARNTNSVLAKDFLRDEFADAPLAWKRQHAGWSLAQGVLGNDIADLAPRLVIIKNTDCLMSLLQALSHCDRPEVEPHIISLLEQPERKYITWYAILALEKVGSKAALPALRKLFESRTKDVVLAATHHYARIAGPDGCAVYHEILESKGCLNKSNIAIAVATHCGTSGVPALIRRLKSITNRPGYQPTNTHNARTEFTVLMAAIERHRADHRNAVKRL